MLEITGLNEGSGCFELDFLEREATPRATMKLGIPLHPALLSLSDTVSSLETFGFDRCRSTVHNGVQKADLQPTDGVTPDHVAADGTVIQLKDAQYWLYAAVEPATNRMLHVRLYSTRNTAITSMFMAELLEKHRVDDVLFLVDGAPWLKAACHHHWLRIRHEAHGIVTASNVSLEK